MNNNETTGPVGYFIDPSAYRAEFGRLPRAPSKRLTLVAFDDHIYFGAGLSIFLSNPALDGLIGLFDELAIEVIVDQSFNAGPPDGVKVGIQIHHSADGRNYFAKAASPEIPLTNIVSSQANVLPIGYDNGSIPSLGYVRIAVLAFGTVAGNAAKVKVVVTGNNTREHQFSLAVERFIEDWFYGGRSQSWYYGGTKISAQAGSYSHEEWDKDHPGQRKTVTYEYPVVPKTCFNVHGTAPNKGLYEYTATLRYPYKLGVHADGSIVVVLDNSPVWFSNPKLLVKVIKANLIAAHKWKL